MSEVLPYNEAEQLSHFSDGGSEGSGQISFTCRLQDTSNYFSGGGQGGKRPPKLGQIGRSKRGESEVQVIEEDGMGDEMEALSDKEPPV